MCDQFIGRYFFQQFVNWKKNNQSHGIYKNGCSSKKHLWRCDMGHSVEMIVFFSHLNFTRNEFLLILEGQRLPFLTIVKGNHMIFRKSTFEKVKNSKRPTYIQSWWNSQNGSFWGLKVNKIDFTRNLSKNQAEKS